MLKGFTFQSDMTVIISLSDSLQIVKVEITSRSLEALC